MGRYNAEGGACRSWGISGLLADSTSTLPTLAESTHAQQTLTRRETPEECSTISWLWQYHHCAYVYTPFPEAPLFSHSTA